MKVKGLNASAIKTKQRIREAFLQMHSERIFGDEMTVSDLVKRAEISRSAFYTHYHDLYEVGDEIAAELIREVLDNRCIQGQNDIVPFIAHILDTFRANEETCKMLLGSDYPLAFLQQFRSMVKHKLADFQNQSLSLTIQISLLVDGMFEQLITYFHGKCTYPLDTLCEAILDTFKHVINAGD